MLLDRNMACPIADLREVNSSYKHSFMFDFERNYANMEKLQWCRVHWPNAFYLVGFYISVIFCGRLYMKTRPGFPVRKGLIVWNCILAAFSILGVCRTVPEVFYDIKKFGFSYSVCSTSFIQESKVTGFWSWMFLLSKMAELGDTIFIILRNQKLIFLHWYHHVTVLLFTWYSCAECASTGRWFIAVNYSAHAITYTYYAIRAMRFKVPRTVAILITSWQIFQMFIGLYVIVFGYIKRNRGEICYQPYSVAYFGLFIYFTYLLLLLHFFVDKYYSTSKTKKLN